jgi:AcrR family transcriptional regulator
MWTMSTSICKNGEVAGKYHHGNLRAALIEEGVKLVEESGINALTLREIGDRVGVSRTAAYRHFAEKADLLAAIRDEGFSAFADALEMARDSAGDDFGARFEAVALAYLRFAEDHRAYFEVMFGAGCARKEAVDDPGRRAFEVLEGLIREGQAEGEFRAGDSNLMAQVVWAMSHGIAVLRFETDYSAQGAGTQFLRFAARILREGMGV